VAGLAGIGLGESLADAENPEPLKPLAVDEPTLSMEFRINDSPFAGREGKFVTSRNLRDRLMKEAETNLAMRIEETDSPDRFLVFGRGELQMAILIEQMRREGYEFAVGMPQVITKEVDGKRHEPYEVLSSTWRGLHRRRHREDRDAQGPDDEDGQPRLGPRAARVRDPQPRPHRLPDRVHDRHEGDGHPHPPLRRLPPVGREIMHRADRRPGQRPPVTARRPPMPSLSLQERGDLFIGPMEDVYSGMLVGENSRDADLDVNITKEKKLTNMRAASADSFEKLVPPRRMSLEEAIEFIREDELMEITPQSIRLRKRYLDVNDRKRFRCSRRQRPEFSPSRVRSCLPRLPRPRLLQRSLPEG
jgi:GTP-binding protein